MSDLYRSAISSRLSKLPAMPPTQAPWAGDDDGDEETDSLGALPGSGLGPPAMQVYLTPASHHTHDE